MHFIVSLNPSDSYRFIARVFPDMTLSVWLIWLKRLLVLHFGNTKYCQLCQNNLFVSRNAIQSIADSRITLASFPEKQYTFFKQCFNVLPQRVSFVLTHIPGNTFLSYQYTEVCISAISANCDLSV